MHTAVHILQCQLSLSPQSAPRCTKNMWKFLREFMVHQQTKEAGRCRLGGDVVTIIWKSTSTISLSIIRENDSKKRAGEIGHHF